MITRVRIEGFQSLRDVDLSLGQFSVIQGRSNSGKSAVIRALRAMLTNGGNLRGTGGSFITKGAKACVVHIEQGNRELEWRKTPTKTTYTLDGRVFTTGQDVPPEVSDFVKLGDLVVDEQNNLKVNVNFQGGGRGQGQFEPPFLVVDRTGSYLAKVLSLLTAANVLYSAQAIAKKDARANTSKLKALQEVHDANLIRVAELRTAYAPIQLAADTAGRINSHLSESQAAVEQLSSIQERIHVVDTGIAACTAELAAASQVDLSAQEALEAAVSDLQVLQGWERSLASLSVSLIEVEQGLRAELPDEAAGLLQRVEETTSSLTAYNQWSAAIHSVVSSLQDLELATQAEASELDAASHELHELLGGLETCPTCEQQITHAGVAV